MICKTFSCKYPCDIFTMNNIDHQELVYKQYFISSILFTTKIVNIYHPFYIKNLLDPPWILEKKYL